MSETVVGQRCARREGGEWRLVFKVTSKKGNAKN
jgi:hypothetical protein